MARYHFKIRDKFKRVIAEDEIEEPDIQSACRSVSIALAVFTFTYDYTREASIDLDDGAGGHLATITLKVEIA